jgi:Ca-activated chloride channel homolog
MTIFRTELLPLIVLVPALMGLACALYVRRRRRASARLGDRRLVRRLIGVDLDAFPRRRVLLMLTAALALGIAAADPRWGTAADAGTTEPRDVVIVLDASNSMLVEDVRPNRLERQRVAARRLAEGLRDERVGVVVFAGTAAVLAPLTLDHTAVAGYIDAVDPEMAVQTGSAMGAGIRAGSTLLAASPAGSGNRILILVSDGEPMDPDVEAAAAIQAARQAGSLGVTIHTLSVGTAGGGPVPHIDPATRQQDGHKTDPATGVTAISRLEEAMLRQIARQTGGTYRRLGDAGTVETLLAELGTGAGPGGTREDAPRYAWLVGFVLLVLGVDVLAERRARRRGADRPA